MRVLLVADSYPPAPGGTALHVERLARNLVERGHAVSVVAAGTADHAEPRDGVDVRTCRLRLASVPGVFVDADQPFVPPWADGHLVSAVVDAGRSLRPDVVHAHGWSEAAAETAARRLGVPLVVTLHDYGLVCPQKSLFRDGRHCSHFASSRCGRCPGSNQSDAKRLALAGALRLRPRQTETRYLAVSHHVAEMHRRGRPGCRPTVVANFTDGVTSPPWPQPARPVALYVGPDAAYKGGPVFRQAHSILRSRGWPGEFVHAGGSRIGEESGYRSLGRLPPDVVRSLYDRASVFVAPALYPDPCPTVVIEALAAGRAVIATRVGGHTDLVDDSSGVLVAPGDAVDLARAIEELCADPDTLAAMGDAGRVRARSFSSDVIVPMIVGHYETAAASGPAPEGD